MLLFERIAEQIAEDCYGLTVVPSERELAARYDCNRLTVRKALRKLCRHAVLEALPRGGYQFPVKREVPVPECPRPTTVLLLSFADRFNDPAHTYMIGGAVHQARLAGVELMVRELDPLHYEEQVCSLLDSLSFEACIVAGISPFRLTEILAAAGRPLVNLGLFYEQRTMEICPDTLQLLLSLSHIYQQVGHHLAILGHRRIMLASTVKDKAIIEIHQALEAAFHRLEIEDFQIDLYNPEVAWDGKTPEVFRQAAAETVDHLDSHTALVIAQGHIYALEIIRQLQQRGIRFPEDINLVIQGCETDWFIDVYNISCVYAEYREQGIACVKEVMRQIHNGRKESGIRYTPAQYIIRNSTHELI
ncbi:substrate-binding domain-containing protein [Victivallis sp. Marseille-Q1083]|uniref:substrate-binding domain-containing protein n=1 Tax=Victivallis sp. Marseille-Q1083 TaxID=2717288 RepID=UPI00158C4EA8|nr:substrate-binding domain-containing protein [Victivallis sp. Marseille-Q1083]